MNNGQFSCSYYTAVYYLDRMSATAEKEVINDMSVLHKTFPSRHVYTVRNRA